MKVILIFGLLILILLSGCSTDNELCKEECWNDNNMIDIKTNESVNNINCWICISESENKQNGN